MSIDASKDAETNSTVSYFRAPSKIVREDERLQAPQNPLNIIQSNSRHG